MYILYALSILINIGAGISVAYSLLEEKIGIGRFFAAEGFTDPRFRLIFGLLTFTIGFLKLIFVFPGNLMILGDFVPAVMGLILGFILILYFYLDRATIKSEKVEKLESIFITNAGVFGVVGILVSIVHLFLAGILFF